MEVYIEDLFLEGALTFFVCFLLQQKTTGKKINISILFAIVCGGVTYVILPMANFAFLGNLIFCFLMIFLCLLIIEKQTFFMQFVISSSYFLFVQGIKKVVFDNFGQDYFAYFIVTVIIIFFVIKLIRHLHVTKKHKRFEYSLTLTCGDKKYTCIAYLDSGNFLTDEHGVPVVIIDYKTFFSITGYDLEDIVNKTYILKNSHYIKYSTISTSQNMLVFEVDRLEIEGMQKKCLVGLNLNGFEGYSAIICPSLI